MHKSIFLFSSYSLPIEVKIWPMRRVENDFYVQKRKAKMVSERSEFHFCSFCM